MEDSFWSMIGWIAAASALGFAISAVFTAWLKFSRRRFLIPYVLLAGIYLFVFIRLNQVNVFEALRQNWQWGVLAGGLLSVFLVFTVRRQPKSRQGNGTDYVLDLAWAGLVYGLVDALFLNVFPVIAVRLATSQLGWAAGVGGGIAVGALGLLASLLVTLSYHLGYPEFRNKRIGMVLAGNSVITLAFLLSGSPWGSMISHTVMHMAAVCQGPETTLQLPPHYQPATTR